MPPPHPLSVIQEGEVISVALDGEALAKGTAEFAAAAALPKKLASIPPRADAPWADLHVLKLGLRDGATLWLQIMPGDEHGAWARVTADRPATSSPSAVSNTAAIRSLRLLAYHLPAAAIDPILNREKVGLVGVTTDFAPPTDLSTRTKKD